MQATNSTIYHNLSARSRSRPVACVFDIRVSRYLNLTTLLCSNNTIMIWLTPVTFELGKMINHRRICTFADEDRRGLGLLQIMLLLRAGNLLHAAVSACFTSVGSVLTL